MKFTNREHDAAKLLDRLANNLDDIDLATRATTDMERLRITRDSVLKAYEVLAIQDGMPEDLFQRDYQPKTVEMRDKMEELEIRATQCAADSREHRRQRIADIGQVPPEGAGGGRRWKLEPTYTPKPKLSMEMTQVEISGWKRSWKTFYQFSGLEQAPIDVVRLALEGFLDESFINPNPADIPG